MSEIPDEIQDEDEVKDCDHCSCYYSEECCYCGESDRDDRDDRDEDADDR